MEAVTTLPRSRALTRADLAAMPDDGHRYELIDGTLIVTPAPSQRHQIAVVNLILLLSEACPSALRVLAAPFDVALDDSTVVQPDVLVARKSDLTARDLPAAPVLAIEIGSPSTRSIDRGSKFLRLEAAACPSYWIVDPDEPRLTAWDLVDGAYKLVGDVAGEETWTSRLPYAVTVAPAELVR